MTILYNILQLLLLIIFIPFMPVIFLLRKKDWGRIAARFGAGLKPGEKTNGGNEKTIWLHALSVGEVTSALPLLNGLRQTYPQNRIVVSVATTTGKKLADTLLARVADSIIEGPIDLLPVVSHFIDTIRPQLFILIETDFWPNLLYQLHRRKIPTLLANGRISGESMNRYHKLKLIFLPIFRTFSALCMQTENDKENMIKFGVDAQRVHTLGNLKLDTPLFADPYQQEIYKKFLPQDRPIFICGSTHPGEEELLFDSFLRARRSEERRVGKECRRLCRSRWSPYH
jgi:3-deoxy-D-manno-octulosonic-acid transferase